MFNMYECYELFSNDVVWDLMILQNLMVLLCMRGVSMCNI